MMRLLSTDKLSEEERVVKGVLTSGKILYGTSLNKYVESIADILYKADTNKEHSDINIYLYKSSVANAFMCQDGTLIVTVGLIAQATSEAEIALTMAHEIAHFDKKHTDSGDKKKLKTIKSAAEYALQKSKKTREMELEADSYALTDIYKNTNYSYEAVPGLFDILQYSYLPFDEVPFERSFVENADFKFPDECFNFRLKPIVSREDYVDTLSSHPNLKKRRENADKIVENWNDDGRSEFILGESSFDKARTLARKEAIDELLATHNFGEAYYNTYVLLSEKPNDVELKTFMTQSLYGMAKYAKNGNLSDVVPDYKKTEGESGAAYHFFRKIKKKDLALLALRYSWQTQKENEDVKPLTESLMLMVDEYKLSLSDFSDFGMSVSSSDAKKSVDEKINAFLSANKAENKTAETKKTNTQTQKSSVAKNSTKNNRRRGVSDKNTATVATSADNDSKRDSKYDNIKLKQIRESYVLPDSDFTVLNYLLYDLKSDTSFVSMYNSSLKKNEQNNVNSALDDVTEKKTAFDGDKILLVTYYYGDKKSIARKDRRIQNNIIKWAKEQNVEVLCYEQLIKSEPNTETLNSYSYVKDMQNRAGAESKMQMVSFSNNEYKNQLVGSGVTKMLDVRVSDFTEKKFKMHGFFAGLLVPISFSGIVPAGFVKQRNLKASVSLSDLKTGNLDYTKRLEIEKYNTQARLHDFVYTFISNIRKEE